MTDKTWERLLSYCSIEAAAPTPKMEITASYRRQETIFELLLNGGADVNARVTPTALRYRRHHTDAMKKIMELALNGGAEVSAQGGPRRQGAADGINKKSMRRSSSHC